MSMVEKNKNLFVITLDNGKQTYFNFADGHTYGVSGKPIVRFNAEAKKILKEEEDNDFLALYFTQKSYSWSNFGNVRNWSIGMVETIYSLYNNRYSSRICGRIADFCYSTNYELNKSGVKLLTEALKSFENEDGQIYSLWISDLKLRILTLSHPEIPSDIIDLIAVVPTTIQEIIFEDVKKIMFRFEHENWNYLDIGGHDSVARYLVKYIQLCELLHHERTYKNLYLSVCMMEKEKELMADTLCADYQKNASLFFEDENFTILIPTTAKEFKNEADYQRNCVFNLYYPKVRECKTHVVFVRKKSNIDTPFITCEVNNQGKIIQFLGRFNQSVADNEQAMFFRYNYEKHLSQHF